jgi:hypothetical protein
MDYSIKSLRRMEGDKKQQRREANNQRNDDEMSTIMLQVRKVMERNRMRPMEVNEILNQVNKMDITVVTRDTLMEVLRHY